jgi:hypothetical protein
MPINEARSAAYGAWWHRSCDFDCALRDTYRQSDAFAKIKEGADGTDSDPCPPT